MRPLPNSLRPLVERLFGIDLRSLALFRATVGLTLFLDLCWRATGLRAFYTDAGVMPRSWLTSPEMPAGIGSLWRLDLHIANGTTLFAAAMMATEMLAALALTLGWRTRLAGLLCFVLHASLLNRNPMVLVDGDILLVCLLFWGLFLPLGARWSVDATLSTNPPPEENRHLSWGSAALLLQVMSVYFFGALLKSGREWLPDGTAVDFAMQLDAYATPVGVWLRSFPAAEHVLSYVIYFLELLGPLLVFVPVLNAPLRFATLLLMAVLQTGFLVCLRLGPSPYVGLAALTVLTGSWVWDALARRTQQPQAAPLRIFYDRDCGFCHKTVLLLRTLLILPQANVAPAQDNARADALLQANRSWVIIDHDEHAYLKWPAMVVLLRRSPLFGWLGRLLAAGWLVTPGNAAYDFVGRHRQVLAAVSERLLPYREPSFECGRLSRNLAAVMLFVLLAWNLGTAGLLPSRLHAWLTPPLQLMRLDQTWDQFAPAPSREDGWFVVPGELADGSSVDLLRPERAGVSYDKPPDIAGEWPDIRWHQYLERLWTAGYASNRLYYSRYLCRSWNASHAPDRRLRGLKIIYMLEMSVPAGQTPQIEQRVIWRHDCLAADAGSGIDVD